MNMNNQLLFEVDLRVHVSSKSYTVYNTVYSTLFYCIFILYDNDLSNDPINV